MQLPTLVLTLNKRWNMFFNRYNGPVRFIKEHNVFLRRGKMQDADSLINLSKIFR